VSVQSLTSSSQVRPGHSAGYAIWVWSRNGASKDVTVGVRIASVRNVDGPHFSVCPSASDAVCSIGTLPNGQADELQATSWVRGSAVSGEQVDLTATASGSNAGSYAASGTVVVTAVTPSPTSTSPDPTSTDTLPAVPVPSVGTGTGTGTGDPGQLFPTISPSPSSSGLGFPSARKQDARARAAAAEAIVPLNSRLIGGQLAGLAVLAGAIAIAIARLSLRKPRPQDGPASQGPKK
jgi:hypothetical protein